MRIAFRANTLQTWNQCESKIDNRSKEALFTNDKFTMPGATKEALKVLPEFKYASK